MALTVYTNLYSTIAQNNFNKANNAISRSIERLSSGLRINHAADDASGLAISEKLRGQIRGMQKASLNAQDAVSFLQTAEGGLEVVGDALQRMRELAVQAGNGTYTTNDRKELQKEVDQLKDEINRICSSTEFNTKKLLTGDAAGLWSASDPAIEAIIRGEPAEGNYRLNFDVDPGQNAIYKTDIMGVNKDIALIKENSSTIQSIEGSGDILALGDAKIAVATATNTAAPGSMTVIDSYSTLPADSYATVAGNIRLDATNSTMQADGYITLEFLDDKAAGNLSAAGTSVGKVKITFVNSLTGARNDITINANTDAADTITVNLGGNKFEIGFNLGAANSAINAGDKVLIAVEREFTAQPDDAQMEMTMQGDNGPITGPAVKIPDGQNTDGSITGVSIKDGEFQIGTVTYKLDHSKTFEAGTLIIRALAKGTPATSDVRLRDIERFTNADGRMILDNAQALTIYGNGRQTTIFIEGGDTLAEFAQKLRDAIGTDLDMGAKGVPDTRLVQYVDTANLTANGNMAVPGTFVIQSALTGPQSEIRFAGDESLINALSLAQIQDAVSNEVMVTVNDAHTGKYIGSDRVGDYMLRGVIDGVDVKLDSTAGIEVTYENGKMRFTADNAINTATGTYANQMFLHIVNNRTDVQIGANQGQTFDISIGRMDTTALEIDDAFVMTMEDAQKAITKFDQALEKVTSQRATIGAQINRLDYTMQNLSTSIYNLTAAESRIRDLDVASESAAFSRSQILVNSAVAMLAQANQLPQIALQLIGGR